MYNPFIAAAQAAISELSSDNAIAYYQRRAQDDIDTLVTVFAAIYQVASMVYEAGADMGRAHYNAVSNHTVASAPAQLCLPKPAIAALPPAPESTPSSMTLVGTQAIASLPEVSSAIHRVLVTPAPIATQVNAVSKSAQNLVKAMDKVDESLTQAKLSTMRKTSLQKACRQRGIQFTQRDRKEVLVFRLLEVMQGRAIA